MLDIIAAVILCSIGFLIIVTILIAIFIEITGESKIEEDEERTCEHPWQRHPKIKKEK
jgi:NTP pyrophosphatase (non-canonical NTP hydrolase)